MINIAIDGPAGSGKSTVSEILGKKLDVLCLDTGAMYRACALKCIKEGVPADNEIEVGKLVDAIDLKVEYRKGAQRTVLDGKDVSEEIRLPQVSMVASTVSAYAAVRKKMVGLQREIASRNSCILNGRDIGTNVLPDAEFKFYLTASPEVRAKRRFDENVQKGFKESYNDILNDIIKRDEQDKSRKIAPLAKADDAVLVDSSLMSVEEVVEFMLNIVTKKLK